MKQTTPIKTPILIGVRTAQPKPYRSDNPSIRLLAVELNRSFHSDVPQLPNRM
jgi:hypothetical protein